MSMKAKTMKLSMIHDFKMLIVCAVLLAMVVLCGMSEARISRDISQTVPETLGTLQGFAVLDQLSL